MKKSSGVKKTIGWCNDVTTQSNKFYAIKIQYSYSGIYPVPPNGKSIKRVFYSVFTLSSSPDRVSATVAATVWPGHNRVSFLSLLARV